MRFLSVNADCFLIELASLEETLALYNKLQNTQLNGIKDLVPAAKTILVFFNEIETNFKTLVASIQSLKIDSGFERSSQEVIVPLNLMTINQSSHVIFVSTTKLKLNSLVGLKSNLKLRVFVLFLLLLLVVVVSKLKMWC